MITTEALLDILALLSIISLFIVVSKSVEYSMIINANKGTSLMISAINSLHYTIKSYANMNHRQASGITSIPSNCRMERYTNLQNYKISKCKIYKRADTEFITVALYYNNTRRILK